MKQRSLSRLTLGAAAMGGLYWLLVRPWHLKWGATVEEIARSIPGDERTPNATLVSNRAVTILGKPCEVWPWLAQLGAGRGGFYSYDWIENLGGMGVSSSDQLLPEYGDIATGDLIPAGEQPPIEVRYAEKDRYLVLGPPEGVFPDGEISWTLALFETPSGQTRLLSRSRIRIDHWSARMALAYLLVEPGEFLMVRKMLLGIKTRVESAQVTKGVGNG